MLILCSNHLTVKAAVCLATLFQVMSADIPNCFINMYMLFMAKLSLTVYNVSDQIQFSCLEVMSCFTCIFLHSCIYCPFV